MEETPKLTLKHAGLDSKPQWLLSLKLPRSSYLTYQSNLWSSGSIPDRLLQAQPNTQTQDLESEGSRFSQNTLQSYGL